jgi:hypothetical protein
MTRSTKSSWHRLEAGDGRNRGQGAGAGAKVPRVALGRRGGPGGYSDMHSAWQIGKML